MFKQIRVLALTGTLLGLVSAPSEGRSDGLIIGLVDHKTLVTIDPATRKASKPVTIKGIDNRVAGFDVRPADGELYIIASNGEIYTVNPKTGQAKKRSRLSTAWPSGITTTIDFNPVGDRFRVMGSNGLNATVNADDGKVTVDGPHTFKDGDINAGKIPKIIAGAYTQARKGVRATALYVIDATTNSLLLQDPPDQGLLATVGSLGIALTEPVAFNITPVGNGEHAMLAAGNVLYAIDLGTGKAAPAGKIEGLSGKLSDIAWIE